MVSAFIFLCLLTKIFGQERFLEDDFEYYSTAYSDFWPKNESFNYLEPFKYTLGIKN
jgi:hypothetical protein